MLGSVVSEFICVSHKLLNG